MVLYMSGNVVMAEKQMTSAGGFREVPCYMKAFTLKRTNESYFDHVLLNIKQMVLMESLKHNFVSNILKRAMMIII